MAKKKSAKTTRKVTPAIKLPEAVAAIDIGSNGIRLVIGAALGSRQMHRIESVRAPVRLGKDVFTQGYITSASAKEVVKAFLKFQKYIRKYKVREIRVVATSAVREARNRKKFIEFVTEKTGIRPTVIDGKREAELIFSAVANQLDLRQRQAVLLDIGGGSVEVTISEDGLLQAAKSLPLGTVRLLSKANQQFETVSKSVESVFEKFTPRLNDFFHSHLTRGRPPFFIGTGGNMEALLKLRYLLLKKNKAHAISKAELKQILSKLNSYTYRQRIDVLKLKPDRADVIIPAALTALNIMERLRATHLIVPCVGLKDGVLLDIARDLGRHKDPYTPVLWTLFT